MKYCVYFYYIEDELVYVGKSINVYNRYLQHCYEREEFKQVDKVGVMECDTKTDMDLLEVYYITLLKPRMNGTHVDRDKSTFKVKHNEIVYYNMEDFKKKYGGCEENNDVENLSKIKCDTFFDIVTNKSILNAIKEGCFSFKTDDYICLIRMGFITPTLKMDNNTIERNKKINEYILNNTSSGNLFKRMFYLIKTNKININNYREYFLKDLIIEELYNKYEKNNHRKFMYEGEAVIENNYIHLYIINENGQKRGGCTLFGVSKDIFTNKIKFKIINKIENEIQIMKNL